MSLEEERVMNLELVREHEASLATTENDQPNEDSSDSWKDNPSSSSDNRHSMPLQRWQVTRLEL